jgi:hypothetical protein
VNNGLERTYKEVVVTYIEVLFWHLPEETEGKHKKKSSVRMTGLRTTT